MSIYIHSLKQSNDDPERYQVSIGITTSDGAFISHGWRCSKGKVYPPQYRAGPRYISSVGSTDEQDRKIRARIKFEVALYESGFDKGSSTIFSVLLEDYEKEGLWEKITYDHPKTPGQKLAVQILDLLQKIEKFQKNFTSGKSNE